MSTSRQPWWRLILAASLQLSWPGAASSISASALSAARPAPLFATPPSRLPADEAAIDDEVDADAEGGLVAFLASDDAAYITGQTINVDGGLIMS